MSKIYYEIRKSTGETSKVKNVHTYCTVNPGNPCFDTEELPVIGKFETLEEAQKELKNYHSSVNYSGGIYSVEEYVIHEIVYEIDDSGEEVENSDECYDAADYFNCEFGEKLKTEFECSLLEAEDFAEKLGVALEVFEKWIEGFIEVNGSEMDAAKQEAILKKAEEIYNKEFE